MIDVEAQASSAYEARADTLISEKSHKPKREFVPWRERIKYVPKCFAESPGSEYCSLAGTFHGSGME